MFIQNGHAGHIHRPQRVLFDHLPKCAGTTIGMYLLLHYPQQLVFRTNGADPSESIKQFQSLSQGARYRYHLIIGHGANELLDYIHPDTITLTVLRDPVDRIISHYFYVKQKKEHYLHDWVVSSDVQLEEYVAAEHSTELRNWYTTHFTGLSIEEAEREPEESIRRAAQVISTRYRMIGFQDDLPGLMSRLRDVARLHRPFDNKVRYETSKRIGLQEVPEKVRKAISEVNFLDVKLYALLRANMGR